MERKEIYEIRKGLEALRERVDSFVDPWKFDPENDILVLDMRYHINQAIQFSYKLKGGVE